MKEKFIKIEEINIIKSAIAKIGDVQKLKVIYDFLNGKLDYFKIRLALAFIEKNLQNKIVRNAVS